MLTPLNSLIALYASGNSLYNALAKYSSDAFTLTIPIHDICYRIDYVKSFRIRSYSGPYFLSFGLNTDWITDGRSDGHLTRTLLISKWRSRSLNIQELRVHTCKIYEGQEDFINKKRDKICSHGKLSAKEVICFLVSFFTVYVFSLDF